MKIIPIALEQSLSAQVRTMCQLWRIARTDGRVFCFADTNARIVFNGETYDPVIGFSAAALESGSDMSVANTEATTVFSAASVSRDDLEGGLWDYAQVELLEVDYKHPERGAIKHLRGRLGEVKSGRVGFTAELRSLTQYLQAEIGQIYTPACGADFGDSRCKLNLADYTHACTVTEVVDDAGFRVSISLADNKCTGGKVKWKSGSAAGRESEIKWQKGNFVRLQVAQIDDIQVGQQLELVEWCDKTKTACKGFGNLLNFRGFPDVPGFDTLLSGGHNIIVVPLYTPPAVTNEEVPVANNGGGDGGGN